MSTVKEAILAAAWKISFVPEFEEINYKLENPGRYTAKDILIYLRRGFDMYYGAPDDFAVIQRAVVAAKRLLGASSAESIKRILEEPF